MARKRRKKKSSSRTIVVLILALLVGTAVHHLTGNTRTDNVLDRLEAIVSEPKTDVSHLQNTASQAEKSGQEVGEVGLPVSPKDEGRIVLRRTGYTLSYHTEWKIPEWVAWTLTSERLKGKAKRTDEFVSDPDLPKGTSAEDNDYYRSRYDRGHMAPAGDMKWSSDAMAESFYLSNICPQAPNLNRGDWRELEEQCREWARRGEALHIVCGPVVKPDVRHKRVGKGKVTVPEGFFKVILVAGDEPRAVGFLYPNDDCNAPLADYAVSVDSVEKVTGIDFYPSLPDGVEERVEAKNSIARFIAGE